MSSDPELASRPAAAAEESGGFIRGLGLVSSTMIVMGSMIGSGIFIVSAEISRLVGTPGLLMTVWLLTGFMTLAGALCYGELAAAMPDAGGQYVYLRESLGPLFGFLYGWTSFLVIQTGTIAAVAIAFAKFLGEIIPWVSSSNWLFLWGHWGPVDFGVNTMELVAIASIVFLTYLNMRGVRTGAWVQNVFTAAKVLALAGLIVLGLFVARNITAVEANFRHFWSGRTEFGTIFGWSAHNLYRTVNGHTVMVSTVTLVFIALVGSLFSSDAWNNITFTAGEVKNPRRNIPLSLALGTGIVTILYLLANLAYLNVLPLVGSPTATTVLGRGIQYAAEDRVGTAMVSVLLGHGGAALMAIAILISCFGCTNGLILAGARVYYAMAKDGLFFRRAGELHPRRRVPTLALVVQGGWAALLCLSGTYNQLLEYVMFAVFLFYILTILGLFLLRWKKPELPRPYRAIAYPVLPALYLAAAIFFDVQLLRFLPQYTGAGLSIVLIGVPVFYVWRRTQKRPAPPPAAA
ncbi:MAG: APC family permease [Terriglobales bacterium]